MIREATVGDVAVLHALVRELAAYEHAPDQARATPGQLTDALFGAEPVAHALVAEDDATGEVVGYAVWFRSFSTWTGTAGAYLEDLFVRPTIGRASCSLPSRTAPGTVPERRGRAAVHCGSSGVSPPEARGAGHGTALLAAVAAVCVERGWSRFEWSVLDWNEKALGVYRAIGARPQDEWTVQRLTGPALHALAARAAPPGSPPAAEPAAPDGNLAESHAN